MKTIANAVLWLSLCALLPGCATYVGMDGQPKQGLSPVGASILQTGLSAALGAGSGALMRNSPGWANGAVSSSVGSIGTQLVRAMVTPTSGSYQRASYTPQPYRQGGYAPAPAYRQGGYGSQYPTVGIPEMVSPRQYGYAPSQELYYRTPDGRFAPVQ